MNKKAEYSLTKLNEQDDQLVWTIQVDGKTIGTVRIDLVDTEYLESPSLSIMIEDPGYRESEIASNAMKEIIKYAYCNLPSEFLYSRHLLTDTTLSGLYKKLDFENDQKPYEDNDGLKWQNVKLVL